MTTKKMKVEAQSAELRDGNGEQLLTKRQIAERLRISCRSVDRYIEQGAFPRGLRIGKGSLVRWREAVVEEWIRTRSPGAVA
jgi:predicted DNA-binding transcriptional regulator AlpA